MSDYTTLRYDSATFFSNPDARRQLTTMINVWTLPSNLAGSDYVTAWTESTTSTIGSSMTLDSTTGYFTFPTTGLYRITSMAQMNSPYQSLSGTDSDMIYRISLSDDNFSSFKSLAAHMEVEDEGLTISACIQANFNVTNTSTDKVGFYFSRITSNSNNHLKGDSTIPYSQVYFIRIG